MVSLDRILCPIDFSRYSRRALDYASAIRRWADARLTVLHVVTVAPLVEVIPSVGVGGIQPMMLSDEEREAVRQHIRTFLPADARRDEADATNPSVTIEVVDAPDARADILARAEQEGTDLIVVGSHGRSGVQHLLLGSTTERILRRAPCPVLVVPRHVEDDHLPAPTIPFTRIVCPVDFSDASLRALEMALQLAEEADAQLWLFHAIEMPPALREMEDVLAGEVKNIRREAEARALRRLHELVPASARAYCTVNTAVAEGKAHREILREASECAADLVVMGVRGRGAIDLALLGSNTYAVVREAACPVLTVHA